MTSITDSIQRQETDFSLRAMQILGRVSFPGYDIKLYSQYGKFWIVGEYHELDIHAREGDEPAIQRTRKWLLSTHMTDSEIVATAFKLCLTSAEHRTREAFTYKGQRIFGPHFDVEDLVKVCADGLGENGGRR